MYKRNNSRIRKAMIDKTRKIIWLDFPDSIIKVFEMPLSNTVTE